MHVRVISADEARRDLARIVDDVVSRHEPVEIASPWGGVTLMPAAYLRAWLPLANEVATLSDPLETHVDAARHASRWDSVSKLDDADSGTWSVRTQNTTMIIDLGSRTVSKDRDPLDLDSPRSHERLARLERCRLGEPLKWTTDPAENPQLRELRRPDGPVSSIVRIDSGRQDDGDPAMSEDQAQRPADFRRSVAIVEAIEALDDILADVASRLDRVLVRATAGPALLLSSDDYLGVVEAVRVVLDISGRVETPPDAARATGEDDQISELRDSDTGAWQVNTSNGDYILGMNARTVTVLSYDTDLVPVFGEAVPLSEVRQCRVGRSFLLAVDAAADPLGPPGPDDAVCSITRMDDWLFG